MLNLINLTKLYIKGFLFYLKLQGVVFFSDYPYPERLSDGYFQRIKTIDNLFPNYWKIYVERGVLHNPNGWLHIPKFKTMVLSPSDNSIKHTIMQLFVLALVLKCKVIYFHSIFNIRRKWLIWVLHIPYTTKILDLHGVVTEEFRIQQRFYLANLFEAIERRAIKNCNIIIVVSKKMESYIREKYRNIFTGQIILLPIIPPDTSDKPYRPKNTNKNVIVYAGGAQKWQQIPKMVSTIQRTHLHFEYRVYCPEPNKIKSLLSEKIQDNIIVEYKPHEELIKIYPECQYGFILREDNIVNNVACPSKLVEYLYWGIIPIVDTDNIGDFKDIGMQSVPLSALLSNSLPNESKRKKMAKTNLQVYKHLQSLSQQGIKKIQTLIVNKK